MWSFIQPTPTALAAAWNEYSSSTINRTASRLNASENRRLDGGNGRESEATTLFASDIGNSFQSGIVPPPFGVRQSWAIALIPVLTLPDPDDRHVLAAAIRSSADVIVTFNLADFPPDTLSKWGIEAHHPDDFINHLLDLAPHLICAAAERQRESLKNPPMTVDDFLAALERQGLAKTVAELQQFADVI